MSHCVDLMPQWQFDDALVRFDAVLRIGNSFSQLNLDSFFINALLWLHDPSDCVSEDWWYSNNWVYLMKNIFIISVISQKFHHCALDVHLFVKVDYSSKWKKITKSHFRYKARWEKSFHRKTKLRICEKEQHK